MPTEQLNVDVDSEVVKQFKKKCKDEGRYQGKIAEKLIRLWLDGKVKL